MLELGPASSHLKDLDPLDDKRSDWHGFLCLLTVYIIIIVVVFLLISAHFIP
jgi:hypothetical protein